MSTAGATLKLGQLANGSTRLADLLAEGQSSVRSDPANAKRRVMLFQLMILSGQWDRALTQLYVVKEMDAEANDFVRTYREVVRCELFRKEVFAGARTPLVLGEPQEWIAKLTEATRLLGEGKVSEAAGLRAAAFEAAPAVPGRLNGEAFEWIADADVRLGPVCEAMLNGKYYWIPFERLARIDIEAPSDLRDLIWAPAKLTFQNGGEQVAFLPARYPGSEAAEDDEIRLCRKTEWRDLGADTHVGMGQRMFATDVGETAILEARVIELNR
jgi:type VI secretion system protein ImpE